MECPDEGIKLGAPRLRIIFGRTRRQHSSKKQGSAAFSLQHGNYLWSSVDSSDGTLLVFTSLQQGSNAFLLAASNGHVDVCEYLVEKKASIRTSTEYGNTPLILASFSGHLKTVEWLVNRGAALNRRDSVRFLCCLLA